jgi:hypothetical protein
MQSIASQEEVLTTGELDLSAGSISFEAGQMEEGAFTVQGGTGNLPPQPMPEAHRLEREYIWGPGDSFAGVDELFALFDREREPWLVLQDASGDVAALCGRTSISQPAYVAAQWTWDAYGNVFSADHLFDHPFLSVGHKGLFVERLDVGVADASVPGSHYADTPRLTPFAHHIYHNRNRSYHPTLGRFLQADPNASGIVVQQSALMNGHAHGATVQRHDIELRYADGPNLYQYLQSSPWLASDPMGLSLYDLVQQGAKGAIVGMVSQYASNQEYDVDWALDWALPDDWHSRADNSWIEMSMFMGVAEELGLTEEASSPLLAFGNRSGLGGQRSVMKNAAARAGLSVAQLRQLRSQAIEVGNSPYSGKNHPAAYTHVGRSLTDHPKLAGVLVPKSISSRILNARFGGPQGVNNAAGALAKRFIMQGIPLRAGNEIKFVMPTGGSYSKVTFGVRVAIDKTSGKVTNVSFWENLSQ